MRRKIEIFNKFKVGFTKRSDTYNDLLGFINPLMQEASGKKKEKYKYDKAFENWRSHKIPIEFFENEPQSGFVVNYRVGGHYSYYGDMGREPKIRVLDPRGFEIEITLENLIEVLEFGVGKGKVLEGEYKYVFRDGHLTLINVEDSLFKEIFEIKNEVIPFDKSEELVIGNLYQTSDLGSEVGIFIYLGKQLVYKNNKHKNGYGFVALEDLFASYYGDENNKNSYITYYKNSCKKSDIKYNLGQCPIEYDVSKYYKNIFDEGYEDDYRLDFNWSGRNTNHKIFNFSSIRSYINNRGNFVTNKEKYDKDTTLILDFSKLYKSIKCVKIEYYTDAFIINDVAYFPPYNREKVNIYEVEGRFKFKDIKGKEYDVSQVINYNDSSFFNDPTVLQLFFDNGGVINKLKFEEDKYGLTHLVYDGEISKVEILKHKWYFISSISTKYGEDKKLYKYYKTHLENGNTK